VSSRPKAERKAALRAGRRRLLRVASKLRIGVPLALVDAMLVTGSYLSLLAVRFEGQIPSGYSERMFRSLPIVVAIHLISNACWGVYGQIWRHASVAEARRVVLAGATAAAAILLVNPLFPDPLPRSVVVIAAFVATMFMGLVRFQARLFSWRRKTDHTAVPVAVVGAGAPGASFIREMKGSPAIGRVPVVVVDDDPRAHGRALLGVPVVGGVASLEHAVERFGAREVVVADPSADQNLLQVAMQGAERARVPLKVLPPVHELLSRSPSVRDVRELQIEDLLGRQQVVTDLDRIRATIAGRRVLITGAGGSIGSEVALQVAAQGPARLVMLDHDETHLHEAAVSLPADVDTRLILTDIRDRARLLSVFNSQRPDVVFHAAAHKHVPLLESDPVEAVHTNVLGTANVVRAARAVGVERLVFISTDKAVRPSNVLGRSKWIGEQLVVNRRPDNSRWCAVRFGNVVGSRGSVIPTFAAQIAKGGPVSVTDPRMTRYFMSVHEAVLLALQAAVLAGGGEIFMLNVGEPVNILGLAERMIRLSGHVVGDEIGVEFVGARPGEKLAESFQDPEEEAHETSHPAITRLSPIAVDGARLDNGVTELGRLATLGMDDAVRELLAELATAEQSDEPAAGLTFESSA
jgi:FlaA1/EpsC-like NDP-sugar epimerase